MSGNPITYINDDLFYLNMDKLIQSIRAWNPWWIKNWRFPSTIDRDIYPSVQFSLKTRHIKNIIGVRRCGKTTILFQIIQNLIREKVNPESIVFINFDDIVINSNDFTDILSAVYGISPNIDYLFLDEVQEKKNWERWVRTLYDTSRFRQIFVSGSSASLLTADIGRVLTGRHITFVLTPFSFKEYLITQDWVNTDINYLNMERERLQYYMEMYIKEGGFPEVISKDIFLRQQILTNLFNDIIARDISFRYSVDGNKLNQLAKYLMINISREYSIRNISRDLSLHVETIERYLGFLEDCFLFSHLDFFSYKQRTQFRRNKKIYVVDNGIRNYISFRFSADKGILAENLVFLALKRRGNEIFYWKDEKSELDFLVRHGTEILDLIQVCWEFSSVKTKSREIRGLVRAAKLFDKSVGTIITGNLQTIEIHDSIEIHFIPIALWLLQE
jgi:hypothetical protein